MEQVATTIFYRTFALLALAIIFVPLEYVVRAVKTKPLWKSQQTPADILHWTLTPLFIGPIVTALLTWAVAAFYLSQGKEFTRLDYAGFGPVVTQPQWLIILEMLLITDLCAYWRHRFMHRFAWPVHSVHHGSKEVYWLSATRFHPIDIIAQNLTYLLPAYLLGFPLSVISIYMPFVTLYNLVLHSPIDWSFGPLRYVIVTPPFHRWHHTKERAGQQANFSTIFSFYDLLFRTYYFPNDRRPKNFGVVDSRIPRDYIGQILYPLVKSQKQKTDSASDSS